MTKVQFKNPLFYLPLAFGVLIITAFVTYYSASDLEEKQREYTSLQSQAAEYETLKTRWSPQSSQNDLTYLSAHPNLVKNEKRGRGTYLEFNRLSSSEFNRISNTLLNSMLVIKKMTFQREEGSRGVISVEFES